MKYRRPSLGYLVWTPLDGKDAESYRTFKSAMRAARRLGAKEVERDICVARGADVYLHRVQFLQTDHKYKCRESLYYARGKRCR